MVVLWRTDKESAEREIERLRSCWEESQNPIHLWLAYAECRSAGLAMPEWVLDYLDHAAAELWRLCHAQPEKNKIAVAVSKAFGFTQAGAGSAFSKFADTQWLVLGSWVELYTRQGDKDYMAVAEVAARHGVSPSTVWRAWSRYQKFIKKSETS